MGLLNRSVRRLAPARPANFAYTCKHGENNNNAGCFAVAYKYQWEAKGLLRIYSGDISGDEVLQSTSEVHGDPRFDDLKYVINDFNRITRARATRDDINRLAAIDRAAARTNPNIRIAVVTRNDDIRHWAQLYIEFSADCPYETRLFETVDEARSWIS